METRDLFGLSFAAVTEAEALSLLEKWAREPVATCRQVATVNAEFATRAWYPFSGEPRSREFVQALRGCEMLVADGMPIVWLSRLMARPLPERVAGSDLFPHLCARATAEGPSVYFLGGEGDDAEKAADVLRRRNPALRVVGIDNAFVSIMGGKEARRRDEEVLARIAKASPDILFVGFGAKKQDIWIARHKARLAARLAIGVGGSFSFVAGRTLRAPRWMQRCGFEWIHRVSQEPRRLLWRYVRDIVFFFFLAVRQLLRRPFRP
jgi:N-acetylglucosaminyldiphosphoundecaprenol N-acetyl-beta-D-mannosaminyltransferase